MRQRHLAAIGEYTKSVSYVVDLSGSVEADGRAHRRAVRDALMTGKEPPQREHAPEVDDARVEVAVEDSQFARDELASVSCEILNEVRDHLTEMSPEHFQASSSALRHALGRGPHDGLREEERLRIARQRAEPEGIIDLEAPENAPFTQLGQQEAIDAAAA